MRALDPPDPKLWQARATWFARAYAVNAAPAPLDGRAEHLLAELEVAYCAGAWAAAVILAWAIVEVDARARDSHLQPAEVDWLRERRNALVHAGPRAPAAPPDEAELEAMAQGAVRVALGSLFARAWR